MIDERRKQEALRRAIDNLIDGNEGVLWFMVHTLKQSGDFHGKTVVTWRAGRAVHFEKTETFRPEEFSEAI